MADVQPGQRFTIEELQAYAPNLIRQFVRDCNDIQNLNTYLQSVPAADLGGPAALPQWVYPNGDKYTLAGANLVRNAFFELNNGILVVKGQREQVGLANFLALPSQLVRTY